MVFSNEHEISEHHEGQYWVLLDILKLDLKIMMIHRYNSVGGEFLLLLLVVQAAC